MDDHPDLEDRGYVHVSSEDYHKDVCHVPSHELPLLRHDTRMYNTWGQALGMPRKVSRSRDDDTHRAAERVGDPGISLWRHLPRSAHATPFFRSTRHHIHRPFQLPIDFTTSRRKVKTSDWRRNSESFHGPKIEANVCQHHGKCSQLSDRRKVMPHHLRHGCAWKARTRLWQKHWAGPYVVPYMTNPRAQSRASGSRSCGVWRTRWPSALTRFSANMKRQTSCWKFQRWVRLARLFVDIVAVVPIAVDVAVGESVRNMSILQS